MFLVEQLHDGVLMDPVSLVFELADARSQLNDAFTALERADRFLDTVNGVADDLGHAPRAAANVVDLVQPDDGRHRVDGIHNVIQGTRQGVYVFTIERRDERAVKLVDNAARAAIARVLDFLDHIDLCQIRLVRRQHLFQ